MSVAIIDDLPQAEAAKATLLARFEKALSRVPQAMLLKLAKQNDEKAFTALAKFETDVDSEKRRSIHIRNQAAMARMRESAFERVKNKCELLEASEVCELLDIKKQSISEKTQRGQVLAYTKQRRKYYPSFQFAGNKIHPAIKSLIKDLKLDPTNKESMNLFIQHLIGEVDYSNPGELSRIFQRFELLDDKDALAVIKRDFINATEMGQ